MGSSETTTRSPAWISLGAGAFPHPCSSGAARGANVGCLLLYLEKGDRRG